MTFKDLLLKLAKLREERQISLDRALRIEAEKDKQTIEDHNP